MRLPDLIIGTTPGCMQCKGVQREAAKRGLTFAVVDLDKAENSAWLADVKAAGFEAAPIVVVTATGEVFSGFQQDRIRALGGKKARHLAKLLMEATRGETDAQS